MLIGLEGAQGFCVSIFGLDQMGNPQGMKWLATGQNAQVDFTPLTRGHEVAQLSATRDLPQTGRQGLRRPAREFHPIHARAQRQGDRASVMGTVDAPPI